MRLLKTNFSIKKLEKLARPCVRPTSHGKYNRDAYIAGKPPSGFPEWPYKQIHLIENVIVNNCIVKPCDKYMFPHT